MRAAGHWRTERRSCRKAWTVSCSIYTGIEHGSGSSKGLFPFFFFLVTLRLQIAKLTTTPEAGQWTGLRMMNNHWAKCSLWGSQPGHCSELSLSFFSLLAELFWSGGRQKSGLLETQLSSSASPAVVLSGGSTVLCKETLGTAKIYGCNDVSSLLAAIQNSDTPQTQNKLTPGELFIAQDGLNQLAWCGTNSLEIRVVTWVINCDPSRKTSPSNFQTMIKVCQPHFPSIWQLQPNSTSQNKVMSARAAASH